MGNNQGFEGEKPPEKAGNAESEAQKEIPESAKKKFDLSEIPVYVVVLIVIAALVIGSLIYTVIEEPKPLIINNNTISPEPEVKKIKLVGLFGKASACEICGPNTFLEDMLKNSNVQYSINTVGADSNEGIFLRNFYDINSLPILLVEADSISDNIKIETTDGKKKLSDFLGENFEEVNNAYVIPGKVQYVIGAEECGTESDVKVDIFDDPYCPNCIKSSGNLIATIRKFTSLGADEKVEFTYNYTPSFSKQLEMLFGSETYIFGDYLSCAGKFNKLAEMLIAGYGKYCDRNNDGKLDVDPEIIHCEESPHYGIVVDENEFLAARQTLMLGETFDECLAEGDTIRAGAVENALNHDIYTTPMAIVNCKYKIKLEMLDETICKINSNLRGCQ